MAILTITLLPTAPTTADPASFRARGDAFLSALNVLDDELNTTIGGINAILPALDVASSAVNFKGTWSSATAYTIGQSVLLTGITYVAILASTNQNPSTATTYWLPTGIAQLIHGATAKAIPVDADELPLLDSTASFGLKKFTWGNIKSVLFSSPTFTGTPTLPTGTIAVTQTAGDNSTKVATTSYVDGKMKLMTSVASTSGTSIDFTGIPSWAKRITVMFNGVSTNGSSRVLIQLGDSGGIENTGYISGSSQLGSGVTTVTSTAGFIHNGIGDAAGSISYGKTSIESLDTMTWISNGLSSRTDASTCTASGVKTLSAVLDRIRITTVNGIDTFDAGSINIMYEG